MRDEMAIAGGVDKLQWMFSGTFAVMLAAVPLFGWVARTYAPGRFLPYVYYFFIANLLLFFVLFESRITHAYVARAFFIWASVFNLFIVSVFWSFMADTFDNEQAKRLFGVIAAGGTAGAITGPALTAALALVFDPAYLLLLSAVFLGWAVICIHRLTAWRRARGGGSGGRKAGREAGDQNDEQPLGGSVLAGVQKIARSPYLIGICLLMLLFTMLATFLYFQQAAIVRASFDDPASRTALFAAMDFSVNALTILIQVFLTSRIIKWFGLSWTLALIPLLLGLGFAALAWASTLAVIVAVQVLRRAGNYAVMRPAREMLYVVLTKEEKYKSKNFIDTVVYRGGDAVSAWVYTGLQALGMSAGGISLAAVPLAGMWAGIGFMLGRRQQEMSDEKEKSP
ncbi:MAG: MFS transporter [Desulfobacterales bacterium]|nr:MFS transporter [Desulfobacterales bacterium]